MVISVAQAQSFFLVLTRILAVIIHVPVLGGQAVPAPVRIGLGLLLSAVLVPWQPLPPEAAALGLFALTAAIGREMLIGTLTGYAATMTFGAVQIAGETMGLGSGFGSGRILNPTLGDSGSPIDQFYLMIALLLFLVVNGHHIFLIALQRTFVLAPVNSALPLLDLERLIRLTAQLIASGVQMALPVLGALLLTDLTLGLLARVAPQVQVFFLGLPLKIGVSLIAFSLSFTVVLPLLSDLFKKIGPQMIALLGG